MGVGVNDLTAVKVYDDAQKIFKHLNRLAASAINAINAGTYNVSSLRSGVVDSFVDSFNALPNVDNWSQAKKDELDDYVATATTIANYSTEYITARTAVRDAALEGINSLPTDLDGHVQEVKYAVDGVKTFNLVTNTALLKTKLEEFVVEAETSG